MCAVLLQALRVELVPYLLRLLEGIGLETLDNPSATKAQIVKALKSMTRSLQYGEQVNRSSASQDLGAITVLILSHTWVAEKSPCVLKVNGILSRSTVWSAFKDQKHDLFISDSQTAGYLTGMTLRIALVCILKARSKLDLNPSAPMLPLAALVARTHWFCFLPYTLPPLSSPSSLLLGFCSHPSLLPPPINMSLSPPFLLLLPLRCVHSFSHGSQ